MSKYDIGLLKERNISASKEIKIEANLQLNEYNPLIQIYFFQSSDCMVLGCYPDNTFKIFKENQECKVATPKLHNNLITCLIVSEKLNLMITGSKDCRVIVWNFENKKNFIIGKTHIIYGHNSEVIGIEINENINIIVSVDKDGYLMIHSIISFRFLKGFYIQKEEKEILSAVKIHSNGLILIKSKQYLQLYK